jgi:hypothetical protein
MIVLVIVLVVAAIALVMFDARRGPRRTGNATVPNRGPHRRVRRASAEDRGEDQVPPFGGK